MKKFIYPVAVLTILVGSAFTVLTAPKWQIAEDYSIKFNGGDPSGVFKGLKGDVTFDETNLPASKFNVTVDVATINTGNGMQNNHAKSGQWFDVEKFPVISFASSEITKSGSGYQAKGILEIHGVKKEVIIPFTFQKNETGGLFNGNFEVNRNDFNLGDPNNTHAGTILKIELSVPVLKS